MKKIDDEELLVAESHLLPMFISYLKPRQSPYKNPNHHANHQLRLHDCPKFPSITPEKSHSLKKTNGIKFSHKAIDINNKSIHLSRPSMLKESVDSHFQESMAAAQNNEYPNLNYYISYYQYHLQKEKMKKNKNKNKSVTPTRNNKTQNSKNKQNSSNNLNSNQLTLFKHDGNNPAIITSNEMHERVRKFKSNIALNSFIIKKSPSPDTNPNHHSKSFMENRIEIEKSNELPIFNTQITTHMISSTKVPLLKQNFIEAKESRNDFSAEIINSCETTAPILAPKGNPPRRISTKTPIKAILICDEEQQETNHQQFETKIIANPDTESRHALKPVQFNCQIPNITFETSPEIKPGQSLLEIPDLESKTKDYIQKYRNQSVATTNKSSTNEDIDPENYIQQPKRYRSQTNKTDPDSSLTFQNESNKKLVLNFRLHSPLKTKRLLKSSPMKMQKSEMITQINKSNIDNTSNFIDLELTPRTRKVKKLSLPAKFMLPNNQIDQMLFMGYNDNVTPSDNLTKRTQLNPPKKEKMHNHNTEDDYLNRTPSFENIYFRTHDSRLLLRSSLNQNQQDQNSEHFRPYPKVLNNNDGGVFHPDLSLTTPSKTPNKTPNKSPISSEKLNSTKKSSSLANTNHRKSHIASWKVDADVEIIQGWRSLRRYSSHSIIENN